MKPLSQQLTHPQIPYPQVRKIITFLLGLTRTQPSDKAQQPVTAADPHPSPCSLPEHHSPWSENTSWVPYFCTIYSSTRMSAPGWRRSFLTIALHHPWCLETILRGQMKEWMIGGVRGHACKKQAQSLPPVPLSTFPLSLLGLKCIHSFIHCTFYFSWTTTMSQTFF